MRTQTISLLFCVMLYFVLTGAGCRSNQSTTGGKKTDWKYTLEACDEGAVKFQSLRISGKLNADAKGLPKVPLRYRIHMEADSLIWIKISALGGIIEGARALITPDSVRVLLPSDNKVIVSDFSIVKEYTGLEADFQMVQDILLGNFNQVPSKLKIENRRTNPHIFLGEKEGTQFSYAINTENYKLTRVETLNPSLNQHARLSYQNFKSVQRFDLPYAGKIKVIKPQASEFEFRHSKVEMNPSNLSYNFTVPQGYIYERLPK